MKKFILLSVKVIILTTFIQCCIFLISSKESLKEIPYSEAVRLIEEVNTDIDEVDINIATNKVIFYIEDEGEISKVQTIVPNIEKFYEKVDEVFTEKELEMLVKVTNNKEISFYWYLHDSLLVALCIILVFEEYINEAISKVCLGLKSTTVLSDEEKKVIAVHEAGHTVLYLVSKTGKKFEEVSIIPRDNAGGYTMLREMEEKNYESLEEMKAILACLMGGRVAEKKYLNLVSTGPSEDIRMANQIARKMVTIYGMSAMGPISVHDVYGENFKNEIADNVKKLISEAEKTAERLLEEHTNLFNKIVEELLIKETLNKKELEELVNSCIKTR